MSPLVPIAMWGWPFVVLTMFAVMKPRHAVIAAFVFAWLFLPMAGYSFSGLPQYTKVSATAYAAFLGVVLFDAARLANFRPSWVDLPMLAWCLVPMASSLTNGLGFNDGASEILRQIAGWGMPYLIGRLYFSDLEGLKELAIGIFIGGLIYMPFCWWEMRMSPRLHSQIYGFRQHRFGQHIRGDGYRPMVFMQHGLAVGLWMAIASLIGIWLWFSGALKRLWNVPMSALVPLLALTAVLCRSFGALALLIMGSGVLFATRWSGRNVIIACLIAAPVGYMGVRALGLWDGSHLLSAVDAINRDRTGSLRYRIDAENILAEHALRQPVFGWGTWGRNRPARMGYSDEAVATDGMWIIALGQRGVVGLAALVAVILLPPFLLWRRLPTHGWWHPATAPAAALAMVLILFMIDSLFNAMINPIFTLAAGGLSGWVVHLSRVQRQAAAAPARAAASPVGDVPLLANHLRP